MKKLFTILCCTALFALATTSVKAQDYKNAIGGRFGSYNGVSFKTALSSNTKLELIGNFRSNRNFSWAQLTGLYEVYNPIGGAPGLKWYYGGGASVGSVKNKAFDSSDIYLGLNGVLGLDYKFKGAPINLSLDWIPTLRVTPDTDFYSGDIGLGVRFTF
ncbi:MULTISPECIES: hypothetical protein [unclassified Pedobacter]|uniref:hypothetical protein n=1 Tax=unclassified Pedobacter TaxID=2628915 RepID=UPI001E5C5E9B|nr:MULTISPECIES: hypothetical protein [unclassified Pedobacter]